MGSWCLLIFKLLRLLQRCFAVKLNVLWTKKLYGRTASLSPSISPTHITYTKTLEQTPRRHLHIGMHTFFNDTHWRQLTKLKRWCPLFCWGRSRWHADSLFGLFSSKRQEFCMIVFRWIPSKRMGQMGLDDTVLMQQHVVTYNHYIVCVLWKITSTDELDHIILNPPPLLSASHGNPTTAASSGRMWLNVNNLGGT